MPVHEAYEEDVQDMNAETAAIEVHRFMEKVLCAWEAYVKVLILCVVAH